MKAIVGIFTKENALASRGHCEISQSSVDSSTPPPLQMLVDFTGGLSSLSHAATHSMSRLHLASVQMADNGNYTCQPAGLYKVGTHTWQHTVIHVSSVK